jgi:hypothetical protein
MSSITAINTQPGGITYYGDVTGNLILQGTNTTSIQTGSTTAVFVDGNQNSTFTGSVNAPNTFGFKNRIINGGMSIAQRGNTFTTISNGSLTNQYTLDRWYGFRSAYTANLNMSQQTGFGGQRNCLRVQRASGDANTAAMAFGQIIEASNMADLAGQTITLSFWARTGSNFSSPNLVVNLGSGTVADQGLASFIGGWTGLTYPISTTQNITSTATQYSFTGTIPSGCLELNLYFVLNPTGTAGTNDYIEITGVQIEKGSIVTPFDFRDYGRELILCQRYYQIWGNASNAWQVQQYAASSATNPCQSFTFPVSMRSAPTATLVGTTNYVTATLISATCSTPYGGLLYLTTGGSGMNIGYCSGAGNYFKFEIEL